MFGGNSLPFVSESENLSLENVASRSNLDLVSKSRGHRPGLFSYGQVTILSLKNVYNLKPVPR
jgi:hypothetical protein